MCVQKLMILVHVPLFVFALRSLLRERTEQLLNDSPQLCRTQDCLQDLGCKHPEALLLQHNISAAWKREDSRTLPLNHKTVAHHSTQLRRPSSAFGCFSPAVSDRPNMTEPVVTHSPAVPPSFLFEFGTALRDGRPIAGGRCPGGCNTESQCSPDWQRAVTLAASCPLVS